MKAIDRARAYLAKIPPAVSGQGGHDRTFHVAGILVQGFALPPAEAWSLLSEYNARCVPPWSEAELRHKLATVAKAPCQRPFGYLLEPARAAFSSGMLRPATAASRGPAIEVLWLSNGKTLAESAKPAQAPVEKSGTPGTPLAKSHTREDTYNPDFPRACARELKSAVPDVPGMAGPSPDPVAGRVGGHAPVQYIWPPPGTTEFDPETGYPIIDGAICPF